MTAMALISPYLNIIFTYFVVIFYIFPELTTVNRCVKSQRRRKKCLGRYFSRGWDWLVMKKVKNKAIVFTVRVSAL